MNAAASEARARHPVVRLWRTGAPAAAGGVPRIVSLVPSLTELLCDLGLAGQLVGCTAYCVHPAAVTAERPRVGGTKTPKAERIRALAPTHLVVNVDENERDAVQALAEHIPWIVVTHPIDVEDHFELFQSFGEIFGREGRAQALADQLAVALDRAARERYDPIPVAYYIWKDPWMTVGPETFIARMLAQVGLVCQGPLPAAHHARYPEWPLADMVRAEPSAVLLSSEPCRFRVSDRAQVAAHFTVGSKSPVPILGIDGEMCSWYGSRVLQALDYLRGYRARLERRLGRRLEARVRGQRAVPRLA